MTIRPWRGHLLLAAVLAACSPVRGGGDVPVRVEVAAPGQARTPVARAIERESPSADGWGSEVLSAAAGRRLDMLGRLITGAETIDLQKLGQWVDAGYRGHVLRPEALSEVYRDDALSVRRPSDPDGDFRTADPERGPAALVRQLRALRSALGGGPELRVELEIHRVESRDTSLTTRAFYEAFSPGPQSGLQQRAEWLLRWRLPPDGAPAGLSLLAVELLSYEEATVHRPGGALFVDVTGSVLPGDSANRQLVQRGVMHWAERIGTSESISIFGHAGIAVGDADGDGLEDLYVCAEAGLPNRLYLQQPDGTLRDASEAAGVDWLEPSLAALFLDLDNDGDQDLVIGTLPSVLFCENDGRGRFTVRNRVAAVQQAYDLTAADYDNDGDVDVYLTSYGGSGPGSQGGSAAHAGGMQAGGHAGGMAAATMFDPLDDGLDDVLDEGASGQTAPEGLGGETALPVPYHDANNGGANVMLRNEGDFEFSDATAESGLDRNNRRFSFAAAWEDYDDDGDVDVYVANDFGRNNLYRNEAGRFTDVAATAGVEDIAAGMSVSWGDHDRDGRMDLYVGNMFSAAGNRIAHQSQFAPRRSPGDIAALRRTARGNSLFTNRGDQFFRDDSETAGVNNGRWAWSSNFADLNNDGWHDLVVANGFLTSELSDDLDGYFWRQIVSRTPETKSELVEYEAGWDAIMKMVRRGKSWSGNQRNCAFINVGLPPFANVSAVSGLDFADDGRAVALVDWDQDGDLDLWLRNRTAPRLRLMLNQFRSPAGPSDFVALRLRGTTVNRDAIGARVEVKLRDPAAPRLVRSVRAGDGFRSQSSKWLHFGLGSAAAIEQVTVRWPGGTSESFSGVAPGRRYLLVQGSGEAEEWDTTRQPPLLSPPKARDEGGESAGRIVFSRRPPEVRLPYARFDGSAARVAPVKGRPVLVNFWAVRCSPCIEELKLLTAQQARLRAAGIDVVALSVDAIDVDQSVGPEQARRLLGELGFPFDAGLATAELLDRYALLHRGLLGRVRPFAVPSSLLLDGQGRVAVTYRGIVRPETLIGDLAILGTTGEALRRAALPFDGRWYTSYKPMEFYLPALAERFRERYPDEAIRFLEAGLAYQLSRRPARPLPATRQERRDEQLAQLHFRLADLLATRGRRQEAIRHYREVLDLQPEHAAAHTGQGVALATLGRLDEAARHLQQAVELEPADAAAHSNLGLVYYLQGMPRQAIVEFRLALAVEPEMQEARYNLGATLHTIGRSAAAVAQFREALRLQPDSLGALNDLAWILATDVDPAIRDPGEAIRMAERAVALGDPPDATALDTLAAAYAAASRFDEAVATAGRALEAAAHDPELARYVAERLALYGQGRPYRE